MRVFLLGRLHDAERGVSWPSAFTQAGQRLKRPAKGVKKAARVFRWENMDPRKTETSSRNSVSGNFVQLEGGQHKVGRTSLERLKPFTWWEISFFSESLFFRSRLEDGFQIYSFCLKMSDTWVSVRAESNGKSLLPGKTSHSGSHHSKCHTKIKLSRNRFWRSIRWTIWKSIRWTILLKTTSS